MKIIAFISLIIGAGTSVYGQSNDYPVTGNPTIYDYSPMIVLKRNTNIGGFTQGIQTVLQNGTNNWFFGALHENKWIVGRGDYQDAKLVVTYTGNVGIGTSDPTEKLSVNGKIRAHEIKVEVVNWPDYVFAKSYKLHNLQETEKHIKEKGHLPGIPSALEVKENGIDLGDMNAKLLQKIEELTLHLIKMEKENKQQRDDINFLKSKLK
ncbi:hypothetical protein SAMN05421820_103603 [Pedobacter steynii]|uniref:Uncharacterized protein n=1 Tax=Pedobacter steynii TaxID=430522 RepID=A0A1G9SJC1_9SPHI|nr:hypothetical protein [Pedobacter steynii]NQX37415.1 hypothetical protein [Pedobacter steynii]SDM34865.1 hypothetical protein SAMN05421820_103603 [Pedobacter steynii]